MFFASFRQSVSAPFGVSVAKITLMLTGKKTVSPGQPKRFLGKAQTCAVLLALPQFTEILSLEEVAILPPFTPQLIGSFSGLFALYQTPCTCGQTEAEPLTETTGLGKTTTVTEAVFWLQTLEPVTVYVV